MSNEATECKSGLDKTFVVILGGGKGERLKWATQKMPKPALSFAGKYRIIDFAIFNSIHSGVRNIVILAQFGFSNLQKHVRDLQLISTIDPFEIEVRPPQHYSAAEVEYAHTADAAYQNIDAMCAATTTDTVLILPGDAICKMDYRPMAAYHRRMGADFTIAGMWVPREEARHFGIMEVAEDGRITRFFEKPGPEVRLKTDEQGKVFASIGKYFSSKDFMIKALQDDHQRTNSGHDFGGDLIPWLINHTDAKLVPYDMESHVIEGENGSYWRDVGRLWELLMAELDLVHRMPRLNMYNPRWAFKTSAPLNAACAKFVEYDGSVPDHWTKEMVWQAARPSLTVAGNCIIDNPCIFDVVSLAYGIRIGKFSELTESVVHPGVEIGERVRTYRTIILDGAVIPAGWEIGYDYALDEARGFFVDNSNAQGTVVLVPRNYRAPEHML